MIASIPVRSRSMASFSRSPRKARRPPKRPKPGSSSTTPTFTSPPAAGTATRSAPCSPSFAATTTTSSRTKTSPSCSTPSTIGETASSFRPMPLGAVRDQTIVDDALNTSWNSVWDVRVGRFEAGWTLEMVIPFKSLRYLGAGPQIWGVNFRRIVKWKNEYSYLTAMPASFGTGNGIGRMGSAGTLVGLETPGSVQEPRDQALRRVVADDRPHRPAGLRERSGWRRRIRFQVRTDPKPHCRCDGQHRLRSGRGRSAASKPDAVQPVLSGEARLLPRGSGHLFVRQASVSATAAARPAMCRSCSSAAASAWRTGNRCRLSPAGA